MAIGSRRMTVALVAVAAAVLSYPVPGLPASVTAPSSATVGATIAITVTGGPANATDWVGMYASSAADGGPLAWKYLANNSQAVPGAGVSGGTVTFTAPGTNGAYNFRLFLANGWTKIATSGTLNIGPVYVSVVPNSMTFATAFEVGGPVDAFVIIGQSNAEGQATTLNTYTRAGSLNAWKMDATGGWQPGDDPIHPAGLGSVWPLVADAYMAQHSRDVYWIPCAVGGTSIAQWAPGGTLYNGMLARARRVARGRAGAVLMWQGEADAVAGTTRSAYATALRALADAIRADLDAPLIVAKLEMATGYEAALGQINLAIGDAVSTGHVLPGPDLSDITADSGFHVTTPTNVSTAAARWWNAIYANVD